MEIKPQEINDFLHLYIGCDVMTKWHLECVLVAVTKSDYNPYSDCKIMRKDASKVMLDASFSDIKPILRKLSDMTEEEKLKLYGMGFTHNKGLQILNPKKWPTFKPVQFQYLLSIGIDLFGLIPAGLAIDKTSLKN